MKHARKQDKRLALIATAIILLAIPISLIGVEQVNDIRNRAEEETPLLEFETDFTTSDFTTAYVGIPYRKSVELGGDFAPIGTLQLGCDQIRCGVACTEDQHSPPDGFVLADDGETLFWEDPQIGQGSVMEWPITISAVAPNESSEEGDVCISETFTLTLETEVPNEPPACTLHSNKELDAVPEGYPLSFTLQAEDYDSGIESAEISLVPEQGDETNLSWTFDDAPTTILLNKDSDPELVVTMDEIGGYDLSATVTDTRGLSTECEIPSGREVSIVIPGDNGSPEFKTDPYIDSRPGTNLNTGDSYTYTVEADDPNGDDIDYYVINKTGWLNFTLNESADGHFEGTFTGTPTAAGSYTAVIALNDGFHDHYSTQIWVINVNSETNDTPQVTVELPEGGTVLQHNQDVKVQWSVSDENLITKFDVFLSSNPLDEASWTPLIANLGYNYNSYIWNTATTTVGTYYFVVTATDNQSPAAVGKGISGPIGIGTTPTGDVISPPEEPEPVEPEIIESYPIISEVIPRDKSEIEDKQPLISADLTASDGQTIKTGTVFMTLDDEDISGIATLRGGDEHDGSVIFTPPSPLSYGSHKVTVTFEDSSGQTATRTWTFSIAEEQEEAPPEEDDEYITILGIELPKRTAYILGVGLALLLLALVIPWLFYAAWRRSRDDDWDDDGPYGGSSPPPPQELEKISAIAAQPQPIPPPEPKAAEPKPKEATPATVSVEKEESPPTPEPTPQEPEIKTEEPPLTPEETEPPTTWAEFSPDDKKTKKPAGKEAPPAKTSTDTPDIPPTEPTEDDLVQALQEIAAEENSRLPPEVREQMRTQEPKEKTGKEPKLKGKPPLDPSDLNGQLAQGDQTEDLDPDDLTIA